jgi:hypothetical protein
VSGRAPIVSRIAVVLVLACSQTASPVTSATPTPQASSTPGAAAATETQTRLECGIFAGSDHVSASATTPAVYILKSTTGPSDVRFNWTVGLRDMPAVDTYMCARLRQGATSLIFVSIVVPGDPGYVPGP